MMALEQITFNIGAFNDGNAGGNNYYAGLTFEVKNQSDNTFASIFSDPDGSFPISQNGIDNISSSIGECNFYIGQGDFFIQVDSNIKMFSTSRTASSISNDKGGSVQDYIDFNIPPFEGVAQMTSYDYTGVPEFTRIEWQGYYSQSDGGSNWGVLRFGVHTDDGGSIFSIDTNTYIEANLKGKSVSVKKFGTRADGATNDVTRISNAIAYAKLNNLNVKLPKADYAIGYLDDSNPVAFYLDGINGMKISGLGARFICTTDVNNTVHLRVFNIDGCSNLSFSGLQGYDPNFVANVSNNDTGAVLFYFEKQAVCKNISMKDIETENFRAIINSKISNAPEAVIGLKFTNLYCLNNYYGVGFPQHFRDVKGDIHTEGAIRSYFVFGCRSHDVKVYSNHHKSSSADCYIKAYTVPTHDIKVHYTAENNTSEQSLVAFETENAGEIEITNVDIFMDTTAPSNVIGTSQIDFRSRNGTGDLTNTTDGIFKDIVLRGESATGVSFKTSPNKQGNVKVSKGIIDLSSNQYGVDGQVPNPNFVFDTDSGAVIQAGYRLNPFSQGVLYSVENLGGRFMIKTTVLVISDVFESASNSATYQEDLLVGYVSGGNPVIQRVDSIVSPSVTNGDAGITYTAVGNKIAIKSTNSNYDNPDGMMKISLSGSGL